MSVSMSDPTRPDPAAGVELAGLAKSFGGGAQGVAAVQDVSLVVPKGSFVSLLGPSGCGKTTTLRMIAGLETPDRGSINIGAATVFDAARRIDVAPARRQVGFVFQSYALWPHMTVAENLAYPLRRAGVAQADIAARIDATLAMLKAGHLKARYPGELSGGQQQRIALGRAVINTANQVVLFDEPLSNLDAKLREDLRMEIRALQEDLGFTAIYVTHDQAEAMSMSDHVVIMREGRIERAGAPAEVYHDPRSRYVADFFGAHNIVIGTVRALETAAALDLALVDTPLGTLRAAVPAGKVLATGAAVEVIVPIEGLHLSATRTTSDDFAARVTGVAFYGNHFDIGLVAGGAALRCRVPADQRFARGQEAYGRVAGAARVLES